MGVISHTVGMVSAASKLALCAPFYWNCHRAAAEIPPKTQLLAITTASFPGQPPPPLV